MEKKEGLEIEKAPEELTEQDLEKVNGGFGMDLNEDGCIVNSVGCIGEGSCISKG